MYLAIILFFIVYSFFNFYHLIRFGFASLTNILVMLIYITVSTALIFYSLTLLMQIDWSITLIDLNIDLFSNKTIEI